MRLALSISEDFQDYSLLYETLNKIEYTELVSLENAIVQQYIKETNKPIQYFKIEWGNISVATNVGTSQKGTLYDKDAVPKASSKIVEYATHIIEFGSGHASINKAAREKKLEHMGVFRTKIKKRYKF